MPPTSADMGGWVAHASNSQLPIGEPPQFVASHQVDLVEQGAAGF